MPLTPDEDVKLAFEALQIGEQELSLIKALPPKATRKAVDYGPLLGLAPGGPGARILAFVDELEADIAS